MIKSISFSALSDFQHCPYYYKLVNVDKLRTFTKNVWTYHGGLSHKYIQEVLLGNLTIEEASAKFTRIWSTFCKIYKKPLMEQFDEKNFPLGWCKPSTLAFSTIQEKLKKEFGEYEILKIEEYFALPYKDWSQEFRGFIDIVLKTEHDKVVIADFKNCNSAYMFNKYKDKYKDYQLTLYKYFFCKKYDLDQGDVETYFIPLERATKAKDPASLVKVSSGTKKVNNALEWLERALSAINKGLWLKNRMSCHKYGDCHTCVFYNTEHCK